MEQVLPLESNVHLFASEMKWETADHCMNDLTDAERDRAAGYVMPAIRDQFVIARSLLRRLLGKYLDVPARRIELQIREDGKPIFQDPKLDWHFNLAHSNGWVVVAISKRIVGVDIEKIREVPNAENLVKRFFTAREMEQYQSLPAEMKPTGFLRGWTCKEAVLKAVGAGMRVVDSCTVCMNPALPPRVIQFDNRPRGEKWGLGIWQPNQDMIAAVAVESYDHVELIERNTLN